ncbi:MAG: ferrochelatase [Pseudomonadota bacterium]|nr:ferrochelatase [Pseudomonadota bacterium]
MSARIAVVLSNLGGPTIPDDIAPFLQGLFSDPEVLAAPAFLARCIAKWREPASRALYERLGGGSPLCRLTQEQSVALQAQLGDDFRVFVAMRHGKPDMASVARDVAAWNPASVVLTPLYPQMSFVTHRSTVTAWKLAMSEAGLNVSWRTTGSFPDAPFFIDALVRRARETLSVEPPPSPPLLVVSAHGLPKRSARRGDPYPGECLRGFKSLRAAMGDVTDGAILAYQSRIGPMRWIGPALDDTIREAGRAGRGVLLTPLSFVAENLETLLELDADMRDLAVAAGVPWFGRAATVGNHPVFINGLAGIIRTASELVSNKHSMYVEAP